MIISEKTIRQIIRREIKNANLKESGEDAIRKIVRQLADLRPFVFRISSIISWGSS